MPHDFRHGVVEFDVNGEIDVLSLSLFSVVIKYTWQYMGIKLIPYLALQIKRPVPDFFVVAVYNREEKLTISLPGYETRLISL